MNGIALINFAEELFMKNNRFFSGKKLSALSSPALSACLGFGVVFLMILIFAFVVTKIDATDFMLSVMSTVALDRKSVV